MLRTTYLHSGWEFVQTDLEGGTVGYSKAEWLPAQVPGHVHLDLIENGIIADPFVKMQEAGVQWVDQAEWSYRTTFEWEADPELPRRVLKFEGLDTVATVWLNDEVVAKTDNMFVPLEVDVTDRLKTGTNSVRVDFASAIRVGQARRDAYFAQEGIDAGPLQNFDERAFVRKAQYMFGWDWGPRLVSCGIWKPVTLLEFAARILDIHVTAKAQSSDIYVVTVKTEIEGDAQVVHQLAGSGCRLGDGSFVLTDPELWDIDSPALLSLSTALIPASEDPDLFQFELDPDLDPDEIEMIELMQAELMAERGMDFRHQDVGISEIKLLRETDSFGESFEFEMNGRKIWARGANWIPDHSFPSLVDRTRLRDRLEKAHAMGFNMLRVWGGGLYESDDFYELCDELGILVWQDFPFGCSFYPDDEAFQRVIANEAEINIRRIRNHPCLALWCGNNENHEMFFNQWGGPAAMPSRYYGLPLYETTLPDVLAKTDPKRSYIASSPIGTPPQDASTDAKRRGPNADGFGDQHNWDAWHGRGDWRFYSESKGRFSSEYGFASSCGMACWESAGVDASEDYRSPTARWHDKTRKGYETFVGFVELHYPPSESLEDWTYYSQLNQRDALRYGVEHYRRSEYCRGSLIWQFNDCWPVQSWAILDFLGHPKALGYELPRLYTDTMLSIVRENDRVQVWAINDGPLPVSDSVALLVTDLKTGTIVKLESTDVELDESERRMVLETSISGLAGPDVLLSAVGFEDQTWQLVAEPKTARFAAPCKLVASTFEEGFLHLRAETPVVDLQLLSDGSVEPFAQNFVTLSQPGVYRLATHGPVGQLSARSLAGFHPIRVTRSPL